MIHHNDHFIFKTMCLFLGSGILVSYRRLCKPRHFYFFHRWGLCLTIIGGSLTRGEIYPFLLIPETYFLYHFQSTVRLCWKVSHLTEPTQSNTKHSVDLLTMHSHPFNAMSPCICKAIFHCMLYHVTCKMNATWKTKSTPLTGCHGQSHHMHMTSIHLSSMLIYHTSICQHSHSTCHSMIKQ